MKPPVAVEAAADMDSEGDGDLEVHMEHDADFDVAVAGDDNWNLEGFGEMKHWRDLHKHPNFDYY